MDNTLSKVNQISHLATKSVNDKNIRFLQNKNNKDLEAVADQFESLFVYGLILISSLNGIESHQIDGMIVFGPW